MIFLRAFWLPLRWLLMGAVIVVVKTYRLLLRPLLPPLCRFQPSCSEYMLQAVAKYGPVCGAFKGTCRICRCHPWNRGGFDPP